MAFSFFLLVWRVAEQVSLHEWDTLELVVIGGFDECIQFFVTADSQLEMSGGDALDLQVFAGVTGQLEDLSGEVLKDGGGVDGSCGTDSACAADSSLQVSVNTTNGELTKKRN